MRGLPMAAWNQATVSVLIQWFHSVEWCTEVWLYLYGVGAVLLVVLWGVLGVSVVYLLAECGVSREC